MVDRQRDLFWNLLEAEHQRAEAFCRRLAGSLADGDDLYQDSLLAAIRRFDKLRDNSAFRPWLFRIIVNTYASRLRTPWWRKRVPLTSEIIETLNGDDPTAVYSARRWIRLAMESLTADERALITLFEIDGWTISELAMMQGKPEGTIKSRLSRARNKMRSSLARHLGTENIQKENLCVAVKRELG